MKKWIFLALFQLTALSAASQIYLQGGYDTYKLRASSEGTYGAGIGVVAPGEYWVNSTIHWSDSEFGLGYDYLKSLYSNDRETVDFGVGVGGSALFFLNEDNFPGANNSLFSSLRYEAKVGLMIPGWTFTYGIGYGHSTLDDFKWDDRQLFHGVKVAAYLGGFM